MNTKPTAEEFLGDFAQQIEQSFIASGLHATGSLADRLVVEAEFQAAERGLEGDEVFEQIRELAGQLWDAAKDRAHKANPYAVAKALGYSTATNRGKVALTRKGEEALVISERQFRAQFVPACGR